MEIKRSSVLLALLLLVPDTQGADTCEASTSIEQTTVACHFGIDISKTKHNFNVKFYHPDLQATPETVLMCNWDTSTEMACKQAADVSFDEVISDQITLQRWPSLGKLGSKYVCNLIPPRNEPPEPCELTFRWATTTIQPPWLEVLREARTLSILATVINVILLAVVVLLAVLYCLRHRSRIKERIADWRKPKGKEHGIEEDAVELAPPPLVEPQVWEEPGFIDIASSTEEKKKSKFGVLFYGKRKEKPEDAEEPMLFRSVPTASTSQQSHSRNSSISAGSTKKESKAEKKAREENEKREAEQRKQEEEQRKRREEAEQRKRREEEEQKQREQAEVTENKAGKKKKKHLKKDKKEVK